MLVCCTHTPSSWNNPHQFPAILNQCHYQVKKLRLCKIQWHVHGHLASKQKIGHLCLTPGPVCLTTVSYVPKASHLLIKTRFGRTLTWEDLFFLFANFSNTQQLHLSTTLLCSPPTALNTSGLLRAAHLVLDLYSPSCLVTQRPNHRASSGNQTEGTAGSCGGKTDTYSQMESST